jgi:hypothetical protein
MSHTNNKKSRNKRKKGRRRRKRQRSRFRSVSLLERVCVCLGKERGEGKKEEGQCFYNFKKWRMVCT